MMPATSAVEVTVYAFLCGYQNLHSWIVFKDRSGRTKIPVTFFVIRHGEEWVAFDTGHNGMIARDPAAHVGEESVKNIDPEMKEEDEFQVQIRKLGIAPKDLKALLLSHGHVDHAGAVDNFRNTGVPIYLQRSDLEMVESTTPESRTGYLFNDFKHKDELNFQSIEGVWDVFGDQTVVVFPTPGHTQGHQSLMVKPSAGKPLVLPADALYTVENLDQGIPPGVGWDATRILEGFHIFKIMKFLGAEVVPSHDLEYWKGKPLAPKPFIL